MCRVLTPGQGSQESEATGSYLCLQGGRTGGLDWGLLEKEKWTPSGPMTLASLPVPHKEKGKRKFTVSHLSHLSPGRYQSKCRSNDCCDSHRPCCLTKNTTSQTEFLRSTSDHLTASCILFDIHWCTACTEWSAGSGHLTEMEINCSVVGGGEVGVCNYENCSTAA